jgi:peptidoglycan/LPS O-acetylase OafA/YrhL
MSGVQPADTSTTSRDRAVDGLRGWAALMVVCYHFFWELLGARFPAIRSPLLAWFLNGDFAVSIFFVLSGMALTSGYFATGDRRVLVALAVKRYARLTIPIFFACLITFVLYQAGLTFGGPAGALTLRPEWIGSWLSQPVTPARLLQYSLADVYLIRNHTTALNPFLWTMQIELWASFLIFSSLLSTSTASRAFSAALLIFGLFFIGITIHQIMNFLAGALFSFAYSKSAIRSHSVNMRIQFGAMATALIVPIIQSWAMMSHAAPPIVIYSAVAFTYAVLISKPLRAFLELPVSQYLGRISLNLYLIQFPVMISATAASLLWLSRHGKLEMATALLTSSVSIVVCMLLARLMAPLDRLTQRICARIHAIFAEHFSR